MLAFEAELIHLPRSLIEAIWEALESLDSLDSQRQRERRSSPQPGTRSVRQRLFAHLEVRCVKSYTELR